MISGELHQMKKRNASKGVGLGVALFEAVSGDDTAGK